MIHRLQGPLLLTISSLALMVFAWPLLPIDLSAQAATWLSLGLIGVALVVTLVLLDGELAGPKQLALLAVLASVGASVRIATGGTGGIELVFLTVILAGWALGPKFGFLLGVATIAVSSLFFGGFGPWSAYQMFATGWIGAGAGLLATRLTRFQHLVIAGYGFVSAYVFGLLLNLWFWPVAITNASIGYDPEAGSLQNLTSFLLFSLASSTLTWDTVRAVSVGALLLVLGKPAIRTLKRAKL